MRAAIWRAPKRLMLARNRTPASISVRDEPSTLSLLIIPRSHRHNTIRRNGHHALKQCHFASTAARTSSINANVHPNMDFFGEPVTFLRSTAADESSAMAALDEFLMMAVTKGSSCQGQGGNEMGLEVQAAHASAKVWSDLIRHASLWNEAAPMLTVAAVGPVLAQAHVGYLKTIDGLLEYVSDGVNLQKLAQAAVTCRDRPEFTARERKHMAVLDHLFRHERKEALCVLLTLLQQCPGDALALSMALDLAHTIGDEKAALRAAGSVASYWEERGWSSIPGYSAGSSLIAVGFAAGGRFSDAERLAERALSRDVKGCGGLASWALALAYDAEGRVAEGISMLMGDGARRYESCGFLFFDARLGGYGGRFSLDREGVGEGRTTLRVYDKCFDRVLQYSGYARNEPWQKPQLSIPKDLSNRMMESAGGQARSLFQSMFGSQEAPPDGKDQKVREENESLVAKVPDSMEDVLTWLPPMPRTLTDATLLLLRLTLNGTISADDERWKNLRNAWKTVLQLEVAASSRPQNQSDSQAWMPPLIAATVSLFFDSSSPACSRDISQGMKLFGELMKLRGPSRATEMGDLFKDEQQQNWILATSLLASPLDEASGAPLGGWSIDTRPILDHAVCHAACMAEDYNSLCIARSRCSQGVTLRPNSPEEWYRYSLVLDKLGDNVAAEEARAASVSMGSGEGVTN